MVSTKTRLFKTPGQKLKSLVKIRLSEKTRSLLNVLYTIRNGQASADHRQADDPLHRNPA
ncbi:MAG: hypothetical protein DSY87_08140 [Methylococcus sp.]|nr:MAG: hypothetical protein DSY87_08140 [Methylococcus sp.]